MSFVRDKKPYLKKKTLVAPPTNQNLTLLPYVFQTRKFIDFFGSFNSISFLYDESSIFTFFPQK